MDGTKTVRSIMIPTKDDHQIYVEETGRLDGMPVLFIHGGPGAGIGNSYHWIFPNTLNLRIIAFDQRGCGKSRPFAELKNNTTNDLIKDIEQIREHFEIENWLIFGGSWGSTLGLAYAISHPSRVSGMILRGIFLARKEDAAWFLSNTTGASQIFPEEYTNFSQNTHSTDALLASYFEKLTSKNEKVRSKASRLWFNWEGAISKLNTNGLIASEHASDQQIYSLALLECHYLLNNCFFDENYILNNCKKIANIPTYIVHGRYDMVCKCSAAVALHQKLPNSKLNIVANAGHSMTEAGIGDALMKAVDTMYKLLN